MRVPSVGESLEVIEALKTLEVGENSAVAKQFKQTNRQQTCLQVGHRDAATLLRQPAMMCSQQSLRLGQHGGIGHPSVALAEDAEEVRQAGRYLLRQDGRGCEYRVANFRYAARTKLGWRS